MPGKNITVMLHLSHNNLVPGMHKFFPKRSGHKVDALGSSSCKNYFMLKFCAYMFLNSNSGILVFNSYILAHAVNPAVDVGILFGVIFYYRINHLFRLLCSSSVIEINQWLTVHRPQKDGEIFSNFLNIKRKYFFYIFCCCHLFNFLF